jgi:hypothetical protein
MAKQSRGSSESAAVSPRRRALMIKMDDEVRNELDVLARLQGKSVQDLGLEAICDLLRKHGRPVSVREAFRRSAGEASGGPGKSSAKSPKRTRAPR